MTSESQKQLTREKRKSPERNKQGIEVVSLSQRCTVTLFRCNVRHRLQDPAQSPSQVCLLVELLKLSLEG